MAPAAKQQREDLDGHDRDASVAKVDTLEADPRADARSHALSAHAAHAAGASGAAGAVAPVVAGGGLKKVGALPSGAVIASVQLDARLLPAEQRKGLDPGAHVTATIVVAGDQLVIGLQIDVDAYAAELDANTVVASLVGTAGATQLGSAAEFVRSLAARVRMEGSRMRIALWGTPPSDSFVVLDLARIATGLGSGDLTVLRPVEAQVLLGNSGVRVFGDDQVKASAAIPGEPIGGWFELPEDPRLRAVLGGENKHAHGGKLYGGAFYEAGVVRVAVKPSADAHTGIVAQVDLEALLAHVKSLSAKAAQWAERLLRAKDRVLRVLGGRLHFELPDVHGVWVEFDLKVQLPHLFSGGGFDLSRLVPSGFQLDFGGFSVGAMPKAHFPWFSAKKLGGFHVPWDRVRQWLPESLPAPRQPEFELGLYVPGGWTFGVGGALDTAWPELGNLAIGFTVDLHKVLAAASSVTRAAAALARKLGSAGDAIHRWLHLGDDGVLRIYDAARPDGPMVGFALTRLLDGAGPEDLVPTEARWNDEHAGVSLELGEAKTSQDEPQAGKSAPERPSGTLVTSKKVAAGKAASMFALQSRAPMDVALYADGDRVTVWCEAPSNVYARAEAMRASVSLSTIAGAIAKHWPEGKPKPHAHGLEVHPDLAQCEAREGAFFTLAAGHGKVSGHALWTLDQLAGATDWAALVPSELEVDVQGAGGVQLGQIHPPGEALLGFGLSAPTLRHDLLHDDAPDPVWVSAYHDKEQIAVAVTRGEHDDKGALVKVDVNFLLDQLRRLGSAGRRVLEGLANVAMPHWNPSGKEDIFGKLPDLAKALIGKLTHFGERAFGFEFGGQFVRWNLDALQRLREIDLAALVPEFDVSLNIPGLPNLAVALQPLREFGTVFADAFKFPSLHLHELIPNVRLPAELAVQASWMPNGLFALFANLGDLFGTGKLGFGFGIPIEKLFDKAGTLLAKIGPKTKKGRDLFDRYCKLGQDGVLRIFDATKPNSPRIGFDLKRLFDGVSVEDLVPVEVHVEVDGKQGPLAELDVGETPSSAEDRGSAKRDGAKQENEGKVLVRPPGGQPLTSRAIAAPAWLREYLGVADGAKVDASLYARGSDVIAFATVEGAHRGAELVVHAGALAASIGRTGQAPQLGPHDLDLQHRVSAAGGMLYVSLRTAQLHGRVGWRIETLLADWQLANLMPDEVELGTTQVSLEVSNSLNLAGLEKQGELDVSRWPWAMHELGGDSDATQPTPSTMAAVYTTPDLVGDPRIALISEASIATGHVRGIELELRHDVVVKLEHALQHLASTTAGAVSKALHHGNATPTRAVRAEPTVAGIRVERGESGDPDFMYATFGWQHLQAITQGGSLEDLVPDDFRIATKTIAVAVTDISTESGKVPEGVPEVGQLHPMLSAGLEAAGLAKGDFIELDRNNSHVIDEKKGLVKAVGRLYKAAEDRTITSAKQIEVDLDADALLAELVPGARNHQRGKGPLSIRDGAVNFDVAMHHETAGGKERDFELHVGWSLAQLVDLLMHLQQVEDGGISAAAGYLTPDRLEASYANDICQISIGTGGSAGEYHCSVAALRSDFPPLPWLLDRFLDKATVDASTLYLNVPSPKELAGSVAKAIMDGGKVPLGGCSLAVPRPDPAHPGGPPISHLYHADLAIAPKVLARVLYLIPALGEWLKIVQTGLSVAKDPVGTAVGLAYTPEAYVQIMENGSDIYHSLKDMGWQGVAMALMSSSDITMKQGVMAGRIYRKLKAAGWKPGAKPPAGAATDAPAEYLQWLSEQNPTDLESWLDLADAAKAKGIDTGDSDFSHPAALPSAMWTQAKIYMIQSGYEEYAAAEKAAQGNPAAQAKLAEQAQALRTEVDALVNAGVNPGEVIDSKQKGTQRDATETPGSYSSVAGLPEPTAEQTKEVESLFGGDEKGSGKDVIVVTQGFEAYLIKKYAALSVDQLGELLSSGSTTVDCSDGSGTVAVLMLPDDRPFVRALFAKRAGLTHSDAGPGDTKAKPGADAGASADQKLVASYRGKQARENAAAGLGIEGASGKGHGKRADDSDEEAHGRGDSKHGRGKGAGDGGDGPGGRSRGNDASARADEHGVDERAARARSPHQEPGSGEHDGKAEEVAPESFRQFTDLAPDVARGFVDFDLTAGRVTLNRDAAAPILGRTYYDNAGRELELVDMRVSAFHASGVGEKRVFQYTLEIDVKGEATGGMVVTTAHTYTYLPAASQSGEVGSDDVVALAKQIDAAITVTGNTASITGAATISGGDYTVTIERVGDVADYDPEDPQHKVALVTIEVKFDEIRTPSGTAVIKDADGRLETVMARAVIKWKIPVSRTR